MSNFLLMFKLVFMDYFLNCNKKGTKTSQYPTNKITVKSMGFVVSIRFDWTLNAIDKFLVAITKM